VFKHRFYFAVRPFTPQAMRTGFRRVVAAKVRRSAAGEWPVKEGSETPPENWCGWPDGKRFAFVLTHDVESGKGLRKVEQLAQMEVDFGFRSSFNFIPEGPYRVSTELRDWLTTRGFEVGVHDLHHDGKLYSSRAQFNRRAARINDYLREWGAVGFRSGFMFRNLEWIHQLDILYDASTFDVDPFEPQPAGRNTIFPIWVPQSATCHLYRDTTSRFGGYIELPYTLPQDFTLFLLLRERSIEIWKRKLDWIATHGGMALMNTHPDYVDFEGREDSMAFPARFYGELLQYINEKYPGEFWAPLPRELATWALENRGHLSATNTALLSV
jgi:hypothetical protein